PEPRRHPQEKKRPGDEPSVSDSPRDRQAFLTQQRRSLEVTPLICAHSPHHEQPDDGPLFARLSGERQSLPVKPSRRRLVAAHPREHGSSSQSPRPQGERRVPPFRERLFQPLSPFAEVVPLDPEPPERRRQSQARLN